MTLETVGISLVYFSYLVFAAKRLLTYTHVLQQEEYDSGRLFKWMNKYGVYDKKLSIAMLLLGILWFAVRHYLPDMLFFVNFIVFSCFVVIAYSEKDPRKNSKKKLVSTNRAKRLFFPSLILLMILAVPCFFLNMPWFWIFNIQIVPFMLFLVNLVSTPIEDIIQLGYWNEAKVKMQELSKTKVIAITGSYGKTSTKHILGHILKTQAQTLITPGSVNTPMGITRIIREELNENHKYFVVEMGAYGPGSIERLCRLTPPDMGIITAVGHAHYERFKSLETVAKTKYELAIATINKGGKVIAHERTLRFPYARRVKNEYKQFFVIAGDTPEIDPEKRTDVSYTEPDDLQIMSIDQLPKGLQIKVSWKKTVYNLEVPLFGMHHGHNAALAFAAAMELGISSGDIQTALQSLPQIPHRLEVKKQPDGSKLIDDAYNSNPVGFKAALDLMSVMAPKGRKILVTPGMVEMGSAHDQAHKIAGAQAGEIVDVAIAVTASRIPTFVSGFKSTGSGKTLIEVETFNEAAEWLDKNRQSGDLILLENDLPDIYERIPKI